MQLLKRLPSFRDFTLKTQSGASEKFKKGFTLIELLVVIAILGVLITFGINLWQRAVVNARDAVRQRDLEQVKTALELYFEDHGFYPPETERIGHPGEGQDHISCFGSAGFRGIGWGSRFDCRSASAQDIVYIKNLPRNPHGTLPGGVGDYCYNAEVIDLPTKASSDFFELWAVMENDHNSNTTDIAVCIGEGVGLGTVHYNYVIRSDP
ncbi:type II secretion system protein [Patescibacteria group bacterium]|nr:type II secretion system protein [Patescibacteria group bacterium]